MTVPLDDVNDIRAMDSAGVPRAEITRRLGLSRNTVAKYADMVDMSPAAPEARARRRRALSREDAARVDAALVMSQVNSEPRGRLAWRTPAEMFAAALGEDACSWTRSGSRCCRPRSST